MISYAEALALMHAGIARLPARVVPLDAALGLVTAGPAVARLTVPGFANAAMDGFALQAAATAHASEAAPVRLAVAGLVAAGSPPPAGPVRDAWEILTGAPVPSGCDAVVPVERVTRGGDPAVIELTSPLRAGQNVRQAGEDFVTGQVVADDGVCLGPHHLMGLAACGVDHVSVAATPRAAVLTTGSELVQAGTALAPGRIRDANGPYLAAALPRLGVHVGETVTAPDQPEPLRDHLARLGRVHDLVLTTGGISAGRLDLLPAAIRAAGGEIVFHKVAIRPGKPVLFGRLPGGALLFGLPGNPLAVAVALRFFVVPALRRLQGLPPEAPLRAALTEPLRGRGSLRFFAKAASRVDGEGRNVVRILPGQESFRIAPLLAANCWAVVPEGAAEIPAGHLLDTLPLYP